MILIFAFVILGASVGILTKDAITWDTHDRGRILVENSTRFTEDEEPTLSSTQINREIAEFEKEQPLRKKHTVKRGL